MPLALTLALQLLVMGADRCYFVTNTRILVLPTCGIDADTIDSLTETFEPTAGARPQRFPVAPARFGPPGWRAQLPVVALGTKELEGRLRVEEEERITAVARRLAAEEQRELAVRDRDAALKRLAEVQRELAAVRARIERRAPEPVEAAEAPRSGAQAGAASAPGEERRPRATR